MVTSTSYRNNSKNSARHYLSISTKKNKPTSMASSLNVVYTQITDVKGKLMVR